MPETIGFIGLGLMGKPMALNLLKNGFSVIAHSRSAAPVDDVVSAGAARASSPAEIARQCTRIITMVPDSSDVERVLEGPSGVFEAVQRGTILIDMSTISPIVTRRLADAARARGATLLDAPVSGGEIGAINASLSIMVGGDASAFAAVTPILRAMGNPERIVRIGESGAGQICKVCNQMVIGGTLTVVSEAIALARKAHVDPAKVREALLGGFAASRVLDVHGERILTGNYKPGFRAKLYAKDYRIAAETLAANGSPAPVSSVVKGLVDTLAAEHGDAD
jgi:2-hydroxy-3-oxopropionate reductase